MNLKKMESYLRVNLLGLGPLLMKKEFTGPRSHRRRDTLFYNGYVATLYGMRHGNRSVILCVKLNITSCQYM